MATSKVMKIVRGVKAGTYFNDKLKSGARSIKAWGWREADYDAAAVALFAAGYTVRKVQVTKWSSRMGERYTQTRLHIS